jgi:peptide/nickel transport system ATP-binding protein
MSDVNQSVLLQVEGLSGRRPNRQPGQRQPRDLAFEGVSFSVAAGERVAILGQPGAGKTALLRTVAFLQRPTAGRVYFEGGDLGRLGGGDLRRLRQRLQYVGGDPRYLLPLTQTVGQTLLEPLQIHALGTPQEQQARSEAAARLMGVNRLLLERKVSLISPVLRQRVALARALTLQPRLLLCDELIDRLEGAAARPLLELMAHACRALPEPAAWVWTTSDGELARAFSDRVLNLKAGRLELGRQELAGE